jgi:hypothetical protein
MKKFFLVLSLFFGIASFAADSYLKSTAYENGILSKTIAVIKGKYKKVAIVKKEGNYKLVIIESYQR